MKTSVLFGLLVIMVIAAGAMLAAVFLSELESTLQDRPAEPAGPVPTIATEPADALAQRAPKSLPTVSPAAPVVARETAVGNVPFTAQAPLGQWSDPRYQDGCEEAVILMAVRWAERKQTITTPEANQAIADMAQFELAAYGEFRDRSAADTAQLMKDYFKYQDVRVLTNISVNDIRQAISAGNVVIVPANGRLLYNPHYTLPGPERHMLLVHGYDPTARQFITNDPGTQFGKNYRYNEQTLFNAIRDYPTGYHVPIHGVSKVMIVVSF